MAPTLVAVDDPDSPIAQDELFGPVVAVLRARDFDHAIELANDTAVRAHRRTVLPLAGSTSNGPRASFGPGTSTSTAATTGAVVGRQPFGGYGLSGVGSKAGGPDYLLQFLDPRAITENTVRQGFAPDDVMRQDERLWPDDDRTHGDRGRTVRPRTSDWVLAALADPRRVPGVGDDHHRRAVPTGQRADRLGRR